MGEGQLARDGVRLRAGPRRLARDVHGPPAARGAVELRDVLPRRGLGGRQPVAVHRRRPREEQKYFLATQQVDEARHAVFFKRFMHEVVGAGDGSVSGGLEATRGELTYGFVKTFEHLDRVTDELRRDRSRTKLAQAVTMYHVIVEATLAQPGQHFIEAYLTRDGLLPAFSAGMHNVSQDEQRHIGFGVKLLRDLALEDPEVPEAVADLLREVLPFTIGVFAPRAGTGATPSASGSRSRRSTRRARSRSSRSCAPPGCRSRTCPGRSRTRSTCRRASARCAGWRCCSRGSWAEERAAGARPGDDGAAVRHRAAGRRLPHRARGAADRAVGLHRRRRVAPAARQRLDRRGAGAGRGAGHRVPRALRGLRRRGRRAARPAAGDGDRAAAAARLAAYAVVGARPLLARSRAQAGQVVSPASPRACPRR